MARAKPAAPSTLQVMEPAHDDVYTPAHYTQFGVECIEVSSRMPSAEAQAVQYLWRYKDKGTPEQDLEKALFWINKAFNIHLSNESDEGVYNYEHDMTVSTLEETQGVTPPWRPEEDETLKKYVMAAVNWHPAMSGSAILHIYRQDYAQATRCVYALLAEVNPDRWGMPQASVAGVKAAKKRVTKKAKR